MGGCTVALTVVSKVLRIFATTTSDYTLMKQLLHTIYLFLICTMLAPSLAQASERSLDVAGHALEQQLIAATPQQLDLERATPQVEVSDGTIVPLCEYEQMQVFNVMGQEVRNEHLPAGVYLVRLVVQGETYTLKVVIR